ncbi:MAG TPA: hypothetical protein VF678_00110 [bacterium]
MNLIGHLACAGEASAAVRVGALLPDLLSLYRRKARPQPLVAHWNEHGAALSGADALVAGIDFHHHVDREFHHAPVFEDTATAVQAAMKAASDTPGLKRFLPAHVLTELFLDHLLLQDHPEWERVFYTTLESQRRGLLLPFVSAHPLVHGRTFSEFLDRIIGGRFVEDYHHIDGILDRMDRVLVRFGQRALELGEQEAVAGVFASRAEIARVQLHAFIAATRSTFAGQSMWLEPAA